MVFKLLFKRCSLFHLSNLLLTSIQNAHWVFYSLLDMSLIIPNRRDSTRHNLVSNYNHIFFLHLFIGLASKYSLRCSMAVYRSLAFPSSHRSSIKTLALMFDENFKIVHFLIGLLAQHKTSLANGRWCAPNRMLPYQVISVAPNLLC